MPKQEVKTVQSAATTGHFSQATVARPGRIVFVSGMTARNESGGVTGVGDVSVQTHQVCRNLQAALEAAGGTLEDVARVDVYVRNMGDFEEIHAVRREYFRGAAPASTMVEVAGFVHKDYLIEINAIAVLVE